MRPLPLSQIASWCEGRHFGADVEIRAVSTDTRNVAAGALFIALRGENFDGHDFVAEAQARGAAALLVHREVDSSLPQIRCADTEEALGELAAGVQQGRRAVVVALTGSNGKTSVKTLTQGILARAGRTYFNPGNRNNEIGLPLAVLDAPEDAQFAIYEMGAGKPGDIAYLASIAPPQVALVNNIAPAHMERMGSLLGIAETKAAIYEALPDDGVAVINADDAFAPFFMQIVGARRSFRFGIENDAHVRADHIVASADGSRFSLHTPAGSADIALPLPGRHSVMNALAAAALALAAGAPFDAIVAGLNNAEAVKGRQISQRLTNGAVLIDDSYNANPGSVSAAIATLAQSGDEAWLVLGNMAELGEGAAALHAEIGAQAKRAGLKKLWTVGDLAREASRAFGDGARHFDNQQTLIAALTSELHAGVRCLVKGSRSSAMDRIVNALLAQDRGEAGHAA
ncbi:MAG TPA: UDP-N-acetylmuramoyl-tripeptide--D-alanyl-D-alanine ligase [Arenimonas sp.]|uniref:UDP-N-acetylmuramoyl-tripeptide--D-alanyl-D- alanine ligase n=1 Tax=Arenimonas sp. TaxID=1872635 RepID=UPI002C6DC2DD|nr:UDP-N-acetylmuramoyl-tripeptide--D-alanyl-D-alanine ligase [Arenimonas sp.]HMB56333.1 UDP-N-acetylmuramoyl-tripeptide--D-alanyl-D-alanine ligase [Arenimonas sp.]